MSRVLVLSPHPDDETIGCGGTLVRHVEQGDDVRVVFLTSGEKGGHGRSEAETMRVREREASEATKILGLHHLEFWREPDGALRATTTAVDRLRKMLANFRPHTVYLPHDKEMHVDHRAAVRLLQRALRAATGKRPDVLMFEVWTPTQRLDEIVDISPYLETKLRAVRAYRSQCAVIGFVPAVRGLNRYRGEMHSWPGGNYAEVFTRLLE
jgi:LmbE family N-acetylglucosaminyl deacetylase